MALSRHQFFSPSKTPWWKRKSRTVSRGPRVSEGGRLWCYVVSPCPLEGSYMARRISYTIDFFRFLIIHCKSSFAVMGLLLDTSRYIIQYPGEPRRILQLKLLGDPPRLMADGSRPYALAFFGKDTTHIFRTLGNTERVYKNKCAKEARGTQRHWSRVPALFQNGGTVESFQQQKGSRCQERKDWPWQCFATNGLNKK